MYRPWGILDWIMERGPSVPWGLLGCVGTEERSLAAWTRLKVLNRLHGYRMLRIIDKPSRYTQLARQRMKERLSSFRQDGGQWGFIDDYNLMEASYGEIEAGITSHLANLGENVILDVTSMPKRFFFPALRLCLRSSAIQNLLVTYTAAKTYTPDKLAENCEEWAHLPLFSGKYMRQGAEMLIVGVGFEGLGLQEQVDHSNPGNPIKLLFPFPSPPRSFRRAWECVQKLQKHKPYDAFEIYHTDFRDASDCFDRLLSITDAGRKQAELAPFGPKPISVGMCIYASLTESEVFYTQPKVYHPDYSFGVATDGGTPGIYAYCIRLGNRDLYTIPSEM